MKKMMAIVLGVSISQSLGWAQTDELHFRLETSIRSAYLAKVGVLLYDQPSWVNDLSASYRSWYAGVWSTAGLSDDEFGNNFGDEIDWYAGWKKAFGYVDLDLTASYFQLRKLNQSRDDLVALDAKFTCTADKLLQPYLQVRRIESIGDASPDGGWFVFFGSQYRQPLWFNLPGNADRQNLLVDVSGAYSDGALGRESGVPWGRVKLSTDVRLSDDLTLTPSVLWQIGAGDQDGLPDDYTDGNQTVYALSLTYKF